VKRGVSTAGGSGGASGGRDGGVAPTDRVAARARA
jgi:hypothetical protein